MKKFDRPKLIIRLNKDIDVLTLSNGKEHTLDGEDEFSEDDFGYND